MSDNDWDHLEASDDEANTPLVKQLRKQLDAMSKQLKSIDTERKSKAAETVLAKLPEKAREKAKKLIGDGDPEEWFREYGDLFGGSETTETAPAPEADASVAPEAQAAAQAISAALNGGATPDRDTRFQQQVATVTSASELDALIKATFEQGR